MPAEPSSSRASVLRRRQFLSQVALGGSALGLAGASGGAVASACAAAVSQRPPVRMKAGHQHDHSEMTLRALAAFGVQNICSGHLGRKVDEEWSVDALLRLRKHVESFGLKLDAVPLPMSSREITKAEMPEILLAKDPERDRALEDICTMIRHAGKAGIPMVKYNLTFIGVVRTERTLGRGGASLSTFDYALG
ncbi:MAG: mannonate dehydratase, partial [Verrucomicrobia bacterium]|nr:mannonate dehydratase [Verrucomicrobiota bacterium]